MDSNTYSPQPPGRPPGSRPDWLAALANDVDGLLAQDLDGLSDAARARSFGGNATDVYRLVVSPDLLAATPGGGGIHPGVPT